MNKYRANRHTAVGAIALGLDFRTTNLWGSRSGPVSEGLLDRSNREVFYGSRNTIAYTVYSYDTPIAWRHRNGSWYVVEQKFSQSSTQHQSIARLGAHYARQIAPLLRDGELEDVVRALPSTIRNAELERVFLSQDSALTTVSGGHHA